MKWKLRWTARSRRELFEIGRFIARDKPSAARRWSGIGDDRHNSAACSIERGASRSEASTLGVRPCA